jgi:structural maintenance of chromosome 2
MLSRHKEQLLKCQQLHESLQQKLKDATSDLIAAQNHLQAVSSGLSSNPDGQSDTLAAQKIAKENEIGDLLSQINQLEMRLTTLTADLKEKRGLSDTDKQSYLKDKSLYDKVKKEILKLESSLSELNYDESELSTMKQKREVLKSDLASIRAKIDSFELKFPMLQFRYKDPYDGFDRTTVKGPVAKLFEVDDASTCTALEVVSGNKLYNVVVDTAETGKHLLQNGQLERHCTIIPLNKIIGKSISNDKVKSAQKLVGPEKVRSALSLIHYGNDLKPAMEFVFGGSFVCDTLEIAKKVSFKETIMTKSVSLSGDIFDPSGILTGGNHITTSFRLNNPMNYTNDVTDSQSIIDDHVLYNRHIKCI